MPDETLSEAIKEAYASAPADVVTLHTLEIRHPSFTEPIRVVRNYADTKTWLALDNVNVQAVLDTLTPDEQKNVGLVARLEDSAPENPGEMVAFIALAFNLDLPPVDNIPVPEITVSIDNVGREISDALDEAAISQDKIEVTYRPYISTDIEGPQMDPPITLFLADASADPLQVTGRARLLDVGNRAFPSKSYTFKNFPGLAFIK